MPWRMAGVGTQDIVMNAAAKDEATCLFEGPTTTLCTPSVPMHHAMLASCPPMHYVHTGWLTCTPFLPVPHCHLHFKGSSAVRQLCRHFACTQVCRVAPTQTKACGGQTHCITGCICSTTTEPCALSCALLAQHTIQPGPAHNLQLIRRLNPMLHISYQCYIMPCAG